MYATKKQIALVLTLEVRLRILDARDQDAREEQLARLTAGQASRRIQQLNAHTGFSPTTTLATPRQKSFLETLERELVGTVSTDIDRLTFAEADTRIKHFSELRKMNSAQKLAPVVDIRSYRKGA